MRTLTGIVISDKMQKTRVVAVERSVKHPRYHKYITRTSTFKAHDEANEYRTGDTVVIREVRPQSKDKRWVIVKKVDQLASHAVASVSEPDGQASESVNEPTNQLVN